MEDLSCKADSWRLVWVALPEGQAKTENASLPVWENSKRLCLNCSAAANAQRTRRPSQVLQMTYQGIEDRRIYQAVSFGPNMLAVQTKILSSLAGEALQPSGGSLDIDLRSESSRRVAGLQVGLDMD